MPTNRKRQGSPFNLNAVQESMTKYYLFNIVVCAGTFVKPRSGCGLCQWHRSTPFWGTVKVLISGVGPHHGCHHGAFGKAWN